MPSTIARLSCAWFTLIALSAGMCDRATAQALPQIVPDGTLGLESSELIDESPTEQLIRGGAQR
ncbi:hypothetical protein IQ260_26485 [Leptolyngbya cf. ectocarpi LEGE 11479]|uniref:Uncharacterized protein n=1 Tax=Leptolyngbya cf. ectocarpi LEGE 11479 TaxID=1828722 RepID=A0A929FCN7_LEPEC|nr:hypothetical protein [Leptolyngbya ectocarpi]MBE9070194.1 hypothetical protein [Leptolyngbya cf. ectocarpi LEGE 11479]